MRRSLRAASLAVLLMAAPVSAYAAGGVTDSHMPDEAQATPAGKFIQDLGNQAIAIIKDQSLSQGQRDAKYRDLLQSAFDLQTIGHFVIGRAWDAATAEQRTEYMKLFEELVLKMYVARLNFYAGETFMVKGVRPESDTDSAVQSEIDHPDGSAPTQIEWRVRQENGKLAIIDVVIEGVSQSVTQRQEYASIIQRDGGQIDGLLQLMRQRVQGDAAAQ